MHELHLLLRGDFPRPVFSMCQGIRWTTFNGSPGDIPRDAISYIHSLRLPGARKSDGSLEYMDYEQNPVYLDPKKHFRPFSPAAALPMTALEGGEKDVLAWLFDESEVNAAAAHSGPGRDWREECLEVGSRVNEVCVALANNAEFYDVKDVPPAVNADDVYAIFVNTEDAYFAIADARKALLDQLGLLFWFTTVSWDWGVGMEDNMVQFIASLRLGERPKRGCLLSLSRDWKFMNPVHYMRNTIPFHYPWTEREEQDCRFFMFSPTFLIEYSREVENRDGEPVPLEELPNYYNWRPNLATVDLFLQDEMRTEGRSWKRPWFTPDMSYFLILHDGWGARELTNRVEIQVCAELYNCIIEHFERNSHVTFFAHYPFVRRFSHIPLRAPSSHRFELWWFGRSESRSGIAEDIFYTRDPILEREKWGVSLAPQEGRIFNAYNGKLLKVREAARSDPDSSRYDKSYRPRTRRAWDVGGPGKIQESTRCRRRSFERVVPLLERLAMPEPSYASLVGYEQSIPALRERGEDNTRRRQYAPVLRHRSSSARRTHSEESYQSGRSRRSPSADSYFSGRSTSSPVRDSFRSEYDTTTRLPGGMSDDTENQHFENMREGSHHSSPNRGAQCDPSPPAHQEELVMPGGPGPDAPLTPLPVDPRFLYDVECETRMELMGGIMNWAPIDPLLIEKGVLIFDDPRAQIRMRTWPCIFQNMDCIEDLLTLAVRFVIPFFLCIHMKDVPLFAQTEISEVERRTLPATLEPGFTDVRLAWRGGANTRASFFDLAGRMLQKPYAGTFLDLGDFANRIALWIDIELLQRRAKGPSTRVTKYNRGFMLKGIVQAEDSNGEAEMLTRDQVSNDELNLLFGYIDKGHPNSDVYLFPPQWLLEKECGGHFHGIMTPAGQALFDYITGKIASAAIDSCWRTIGEWRSFLRSAGKGRFKAKDFPVDDNFEHGSKLLKKVFGGSWNMRVLRDITVPEPFLDDVPDDSSYGI
ncbi:hypothetical protein DFH09DRAFT_1113832 [Mycena vulgaris]|nr:hypothetical protein DFH09DRAFT_1113832 [Mycena vulgaris]